MDNISRRSFLKGLIAASSLAALPVGVQIIAKGFVDDTYYMTEGETIEGMNNPEWAKIVMADNCSILNCNLINTTIEVRGDCCTIHNSILCTDANGVAIQIT